MTTQTFPRTKKRIRGMTVKAYKIKTNFENYTTLEMPSQEYISSYIAHCLIDKKMPLGSIRFEYEEITLFYRLTRVLDY